MIIEGVFGVEEDEPALVEGGVLLDGVDIVTCLGKTGSLD